MTRPGPPGPESRRGVRPVIRLCVIALATGIGGLVLLTALQDRLIFFPDRRIDATPAGGRIPFDDVLLRTADGETITGWFVPSENADATVLFLHGNAGNISHRLHAISGLTGVSLNVLIVDYRGYGGSSGSPTGPGLLHDATAAWVHLTRERRIPAARIVLYGESIGSVPALRLVRRLAAEGAPLPAAVVLEGAFTSALEMGRRAFPFLPVRWILRDTMDNLDAIQEVHVPTLFIHAGEDEIAPKSMGRRLFEASPSELKEFHEVAGAMHNTLPLVAGPGLYSRIADFIGRALRAGSESGRGTVEVGA